MHVRKFLSIFLVSLVFVIAGCGGGGSSSGIGGDESAPDTDGDGIVNEHDGDIDGDGIPNQNDDDVDGDGVTNDQDGDDDNDGIADDNDSTPEGPPSGNGDSDNDGIPDKDDPDTPSPAQCTSAKIIVPNSEIQTGQTGVRVKWDLLPTGCELTAEKNVTIQITAFNQWANPDTRYSGKKTVGEGYAGINIPNNCNWDRTTKKKITYDFSALGTALGDSDAKTAAYIQDVTHPVGEGACDTPDTPAVVDLEKISHDRNATCSVKSSGAVRCEGAQISSGTPAKFYAVWTKVTEALPIGYYQSPPTWTATGDLFMNIYLRGTDCGTDGTGRADYYGGGQTEWDALLAANAGCTVRTDYRETTPVTWMNLGIPGNFFLRIGDAATTISKYNIPTPSSNAVEPVIADSNIGRLKSASCTQNDPTSSAVTCTADTAGEFWLWAENPQKVRSLGDFRKPTWTVSPYSGDGVHIYLTKTDECEAAFPDGKADSSSKLSWLFVYRGTQDGVKWDGLANACTVRTTLKETPGSEYQSMPQPGNFILKAGSHKSITITKFSVGKLN